MTKQEGIASYLAACKHDVAHLPGAPQEDIAAWAAANAREGERIFNEALQARIASNDENGCDPAEAALQAVKKWAQGALFRG